MPNNTNANDAFSSQNQQSNNQSGQNNAKVEDYLKQLLDELEKLVKQSANGSQSAAADRRAGSKYANIYDELFTRGGSRKRSAGGLSDFIEDGFKEAIFGADYKEKLGKSVSDFAQQFGIDLENAEEQLGKELGKRLVNSSKLGKMSEKIIGGIGSSLKNKATQGFMKGVGRYDRANGTNWSSAAQNFFRGSSSSGQSARAAAEAATSATAEAAAATEAATAEAAASATAGLGEVAASAKGAGAAVEGAAGAIAAVGPEVLLAAVAFEIVTSAFNSALDGTIKLFNGLTKAGFRYMESQEQMLEFEKRRIAQDTETIIRKPFEILEAAAKNVYDAWDNYVRKINATQGYSKDNLQSLMGAYAERLRSDELAGVISTTDIVSSLASVLDSGLSGKAAEEFAYTASKLNAAIPTQDFFSYASTYASVAANAIKNGKSQSEALALANQELYSFADSILYASRNLSGGFTTGLQNASHLFEQSVQIAQSGRSTNISGIGNVLTAVSAVVGAIAPDLASSITDIIYKSAVGGNSSDIVALRSLANINASNSEFLSAFAKDPQAVFSQIFSNLASMQHLADGAWMEVAEGLSSVFGVSMDAFARVDFAYLADVLSNMRTNGDALRSNLNLLIAGQTTTNEDQLRIAQINKYLIEEGLAYVMDNDAARAIQQHMWDEQIAQEIMEAEYGVNLHGAALDFLQGIRKGVDIICSLLNPIGFITRIVNNIADTRDEYYAQQEDLKQILELGKVGWGNARAMYQLTTRGTKLGLTDSLVNLLGGTSAYAHLSRQSTEYYKTLSPIIQSLHSFATPDANSNAPGTFWTNILNSIKRYRIPSAYEWGMVSKSDVATRSGTSSSAPIITGADIAAAKNEANTSMLVSKMKQFLDESYLRSFAEDTSKTYEDWIQSASKLGISDMDAALKAVGKNEEDLRGMFSDVRTDLASQESRRRDAKEEDFWDSTLDYHPAVTALITTTNDLSTTTNSLLNTTNELLKANNLTLSYILKKEEAFYTDWVNYFVRHTAYDNAYDYSKVAKIKRDEASQSDTAIYALAEALSKNTVDLKDPAMQTNALLSQILLVVNAIMQRSNQTGATSLLGTLAGLALGGDAKTI